MKNKKIIVNIQSIIDVITNSSTEVFTMATDSTVKYAYEILSAILPNENVKEIFDIKIEYSEYLYENFIDSYIYDNLEKEIVKLMPEELSKNYSCKDLVKTYEKSEYMKKTFEEYMSYNDCKQCDIAIYCNNKNYEKYANMIKNLLNSVETDSYYS